MVYVASAPTQIACPRRIVPSRAKSHAFYFKNLPKELLISEDKMAKLSPSNPLNLNVLIPSTLPERWARLTCTGVFWSWKNK